jgi:hypothetical protein
MKIFEGKTLNIEYPEGLNGVVTAKLKDGVICQLDGEDLKDFITKIVYEEFSSLLEQYNPLRKLSLFRKRN